jgi:asparagine synthase (glutamine-hydrolysing)
MTAAIENRGPDDSGSWFDERTGMALGHRRLSIIDVSSAGHQPMESRSGRFRIVFNGEIYNFDALRQELHARGAEFRGHSDTEVILAAVEEWGLEPAVNRFVGMFAMGLWDREASALHLVRDRLGEKPLFYGWLGNSLVFGSELSVLRAHPQWTGEIDRGALSLLLRHNCIPAPYSIFRQVRKVMPGTILSFAACDPAADPTKRTYWSAREMAERAIADQFDLPEREMVDACEARLTRTIRREMVADVPLGAFLSGGIDSSLVVALMQAQDDRPVKTFTIGFGEDDYNEAAYAKAIAGHLGTDHTELYVSAAEALEVIPRLPTIYDEPFADVSQIPTYMVAQLARQQVTVSLSGDGGDELFGGYYRYVWGERLWSRLRRIPLRLRGLISGGIRSVPAERWNSIVGAAQRLLPGAARVSTPGDRMHKLAGVMDVESPERLYLALASHWQNPAEVVLGGAEHPTLVSDESSWPDLPSLPHTMMYLDLVSYLPDDILVKVDRSSMAVSLESRAPFLDHEFVEFAWRVPMKYKIRNGQGKWLLRQVLYRHVPPELVERPKMGFAVPIDRWLRGELRDWAEDLLSERRLREEGFFDPAIVRRTWEEHQSGARNWQYLLWDVLMFQGWRDGNR